MRLLKQLGVIAAAALMASSALGQDRPDLMDLNPGSPTAMGVIQVFNDTGMGSPTTGANNRIGNGSIDHDSSYGGLAYMTNTLAGTVPATANGGVTVNFAWFTQEYDKASHGAKSDKIDQKAELAFKARILTAMGATADFTTMTAMGATNTIDLEWDNDMGGGGIDDCSAKFQAKGVPTPIGTSPAPIPTSAKWDAKCKQSTYATVLTAIGVPAANQTTILSGLGVAGTDKITIKGQLK